MKTIPFAIAMLTTAALYAADKKIPNRLIDYQGFQKGAAEVAKMREQRRITEEQFIKMAAESDTVVYDARSADKFQRLHMKGAKHLSLPDVTAEELTKISRTRPREFSSTATITSSTNPAHFLQKWHLHH